MNTPEALPVASLSDIGVYPLQEASSVIGHDFCFEWSGVQSAALKRGTNLDAFLTVPLAKRLAAKRMKSRVTFWFAPLEGFFVVTVCGPKNADFFDPLHGLPGYAEYGGNYLRPHARPFLHWDGERILRVHVVESLSSSQFLVADFGNGFGLTVAPADEDGYRAMEAHPEEFFDHSAVPNSSPTPIGEAPKILDLHHVLCVWQQEILDRS